MSVVASTKVQDLTDWAWPRWFAYGVEVRTLWPDGSSAQHWGYLGCTFAAQAILVERQGDAFAVPSRLAGTKPVLCLANGGIQFPSGPPSGASAVHERYRL